MRCQTSDGEVFDVSPEVIATCGLLGEFLENADDASVVPLPNIDAVTFRALLRGLCEDHIAAANMGGSLLNAAALYKDNIASVNIGSLLNAANYLGAQAWITCVIDHLMRAWHSNLCCTLENIRRNVGCGGSTMRMGRYRFTEAEFVQLQRAFLPDAPLGFLASVDLVTAPSLRHVTYTMKWLYVIGVLGGSVAFYDPDDPLDSLERVCEANATLVDVGVMQQFLYQQPVRPLTADQFARFAETFTPHPDITQACGPVDLFDTSELVSMDCSFCIHFPFASMRVWCHAVIRYWDVRRVTSMRDLFRGASTFNALIDLWDVSSVTDMSHMFNGAIAFNQPIGAWAVNNVETMDGMFQQACAFNQPIGAWRVDNVRSMASMFNGAFAFNQPIGRWNTAKVTTMQNMFCSAYRFQAAIGSWDTGAVTTMAGMFYGAFAFNQPIGAWTVDNVVDMSEMFCGARAFNQPIGAWNVLKVTTMTDMFHYATAFNQPIGAWTVDNVTNMNQMFAGAHAFNQSIDTWAVANVTSRLHMFDGAYSFQQNRVFDNGESRIDSPVAYSQQR